MSTTTTAAPAPSTSATATVRLAYAVRAEPEAVWQALVDGSVTPAYYYGFEAHFPALQAGAAYRYTAGGGDMITGVVEDVELGRRLVLTFDGVWAPDIAELPTSRVTFEVVEPFMPMPGVTVLRCTHEGLPAGAAADHLEIGWVAILSGLKTLLETGQPLVAAPGGTR
ncbi:SRPBCC domain-containing protein [Aquipuribacter nitratireducens]|uniref:SRPBCC domain-containing protein n=1 Tax=Aquipuribacter nitratireducens TaxID=650104 RepID=A0ABW0GPW5_9MICO